MTDFNNQSGLDFADISSEEYRVYHFPHGELRLNSPERIHVSASGGHRIFTADGVSHYIPPGWFHLEWKAREGEPHFVK